MQLPKLFGGEEFSLFTPIRSIVGRVFVAY